MTVKLNLNWTTERFLLGRKAFYSIYSAGAFIENLVEYFFRLDSHSDPQEVITNVKRAFRTPPKRSWHNAIFLIKLRMLIMTYFQPHGNMNAKPLEAVADTVFLLHFCFEGFLVPNVQCRIFARFMSLKPSFTQLEMSYFPTSLHILRLFTGVKFKGNYNE